MAKAERGEANTRRTPSDVLKDTCKPLEATKRGRPAEIKPSKAQQ